MLGKTISRPPGSMPVTLGQRFTAGQPQKLFDVPVVRYDVARDGRFLVLTWAADYRPKITVLLNWTALVKR